MKIEYDSKRDLLYLRVSEKSGDIVETRTITPGVLADFDVENRLVGIEVLDARELLGSEMKIEMRLPDMATAGA